jgi:hypothetical protein
MPSGGRGASRGNLDRPWRKLAADARLAALAGIDTGTYLAAYEIRGALDYCARAGHRIGVRPWGYYGPRQYHGHWIDRYAHYNSGWRKPKSRYSSAIKRRRGIVRRFLAR